MSAAQGAASQNNLETVEDAMVVIQKSLDTIKKTADKFDELEGNSKEVLAAMTQLTNKVTSLESKIDTAGIQSKRSASIIDVPLYIRVSVHGIIYACHDQLYLNRYMHACACLYS